MEAWVLNTFPILFSSCSAGVGEEQIFQEGNGSVEAAVDLETLCGCVSGRWALAYPGEQDAQGPRSEPVVIRAHMPSKASCRPSALQPCREWGGMLLFYRDSALHSGPKWQSRGESLHLSL